MTNGLTGSVKHAYQTYSWSCKLFKSYLQPSIMNTIESGVFSQVSKSFHHQ